MSHKTITVTRDQILAARALIQLRGGPDKVEPLIVKIAGAARATRRAPAKAG